MLRGFLSCGCCLWSSQGLHPRQDNRVKGTRPARAVECLQPLQLPLGSTPPERSL